MNEELEERFKNAVAIALTMKQADLPQDIQLRLYAYYKKATFENPRYPSSGTNDLRSAFKSNATMQIMHISVDEAKLKYIELINELIK